MTPGYKNVSFWMVLAATLGSAFVASGAPVGDSMIQGAGAVLAMLLAGGYASVRAFAKGKDGKPAHKSTEFYLSLGAVIVGALLASGVFPSDGVALKVLGGAASLLTALGYSARFALPPR